MHMLTAKEQALSKIFCDDYIFTIPGYQRPYAWGTEQARELLDDLLAAANAAPDDVTEATPYFLGSIVLIKSDSSVDATVVDGQQRLTTLTLLLSAIRATVGNDDVQKDITNCLYEKASIVKGTKDRYRLSLRERDRDFFREYVQHEGGLHSVLQLNSKLPDAQARLRANAQVFMTELGSLSEAALLRLVRFVMHRCYLVLVATPDLDSAYRIFGVLNSRGLDLSATDILKAEIIGGLPKDLRDAYTKKWEDEEELLGRDEFGELFSHIRMVYRKAKPQGTLLKEFKEHVGAVEQPGQFIDTLLIPMAQALREMRDMNYSSQQFAEEVNDYLRWLKRLEFKDWVPPALAFFIRHREHPNMVLDFFRDLERLAYSMLARKAGINERIERFSLLTSAVEEDAELFEDSSPLQLSPEEQHDTYAALNGPLYETHSPRALALLLLRLDRLMADGTATYQHDVVSVEHVMPQQPAPNSQWVAWVPDTDSHQAWVHRLGNLALLSRSKNSAASNHDLEWKKTAYFSKNGVCSFALTTQVLQHAQWTVDVMQQRQANMIAKLETHLRLEKRKSKADIASAVAASLAAGDGTVAYELRSSRHGLSATAVEKGNVFTVLAGAKAKLEWNGKPHTYSVLRDDLIKTGILTLSKDQTHLVFSTDTDFKKPSAAAATVLGRPDNGRNSWKVKGTSITYAAWHDNLPATQIASIGAESVPSISQV
ncbi:DUF4357 domain-containing protein [Pseudoduganella umbonata]|nr:DUF4357 domain-containing protein [Pseudoduganella umbonata]MBB3223455.1 hypothetical protein [Pseudoduganella umbonata]